MVIVGFALKLDSIAVIIISALATGFAAHMDITEILSILGQTFVNQRLITIFILSVENEMLINKIIILIINKRMKRYHFI